MCTHKTSTIYKVGRGVGRSKEQNMLSLTPFTLKNAHTQKQNSLYMSQTMKLPSLDHFLTCKNSIFYDST